MGDSPKEHGPTLVLVRPRGPLAPVGLTPCGAFDAAWPGVRARLALRPSATVLAAVSLATGDVVTHSIVDAEVADVLVGRHRRCDLRIPDESVSLRQLLVRVYRPTEGRETPRVRLVDLRTHSGLADLAGAAAPGLLSDSHLAARFGGWILFVLAGEHLAAGLHVDDAFAALEHTETVRAGPTELAPGPLRVRPRLRIVEADAANATRPTRIAHVEGTLRLHAIDPGVREDAIGAVILEGAGAAGQCVRLTPSALAAGVLLGRYDRCQLQTSAAVGGIRLSRVHLCLLLDEYGLWAVDTASTNGTACDGQRFRTRRLGRNDTLDLAGDLTIRWAAA